MQIISKLKTGLKASWDATKLFFSWKVGWSFYMIWLSIILDSFFRNLTPLVDVPDYFYLREQLGEHERFSTFILYLSIFIAIVTSIAVLLKERQKAVLCVYCIHIICLFVVGSLLHGFLRDILFALSLG